MGENGFKAADPADMQKDREVYQSKFGTFLAFKKRLEGIEHDNNRI